MSITLPPIPLPSIDTWPNTPEKLRARDLEVAKAVLEAAAKLCEAEAWRLKGIAVQTQSAATNTRAIQASHFVDLIRALEIKHAG